MVPPFCPGCGAQTTYNGYNIYTKKGLGSVKIGRYRCPSCEKLLEEGKGFWEELKEDLFDVLKHIYQRMMVHHVSYRGISWIFDIILSKGKDTSTGHSMAPLIVPSLPVEDI
ncbi:MAG TPA: hypothetical protein ENH28_05480 [Euryarchaeota archaeon]|nr:hypothetical protein [Euryarchaeota archaeon]